MIDNLVIPIVNINGDKKETLLKQLLDCYASIFEAKTKFYAAMPHGRNYQLYENWEEESNKARKQHTIWIESLTKIEGEITQLYEAIYAQGK